MDSAHSGTVNKDHLVCLLESDLRVFFGENNAESESEEESAELARAWTV